MKMDHNTTSGHASTSTSTSMPGMASTQPLIPPVKFGKKQEMDSLMTQEPAERQQTPQNDGKRSVWSPSKVQRAIIQKWDQRRVQASRTLQIPPPSEFSGLPDQPKESTPKEGENKEPKDERWDQRPQTPQIPPPTTSPLSKENTPEKEETVQEERTPQIPPPPTSTTSPLSDEKKEQEGIKEWWPKSSSAPAFVWPPTEEEEATITKVLYTPSGRKRLPIFESICPS